MWFDVRANEICVKFRFTGSRFSAPSEQNCFSPILTEERVIWETNYSTFHYSLKIIDEPKMSEIRILNFCHKKSIFVDIYRRSLLTTHNPSNCIHRPLNHQTSISGLPFCELPFIYEPWGEGDGLNIFLTVLGRLISGGAYIRVISAPEDGPVWKLLNEMVWYFIAVYICNK